MGHLLMAIWQPLGPTPLPWLAVTITAYVFGQMVQRLCKGTPLANPVLTAILAVSVLLEATGTPYARYFAGAQFIQFLLGPATVALAVPMYDNLPAIKRNFVAIFVSLTAGSLVAAGSAMLIARALGASHAVVIALGPKSVTTPIAMGIAQDLGGQPALTAVFVMITGMFGTLICTTVFKWARVRDWRAQGLAAGTAAHGLATSRMLLLSQTAGAFGGLAIGLNGLVTSILVPLLVSLFGF